MEDKKIVELYVGRDESAITKSKDKYGNYIISIAFGILRDHGDAAECENDTYLSAWNCIPPQIPHNLKTFLGRIARNISISEYRKKHADKRGGDTDILMSELEECKPGTLSSEDYNIERDQELHELTAAINNYLKNQKRDNRIIFVKRYWYGMSISEIAHETGMSESNISTTLHRMRAKLKVVLESEGIVL